MEERVGETRDVCVCVCVCVISVAEQKLQLAHGRLALRFSLLLVINPDGWWMAGCRRRSALIYESLMGSCVIVLACKPECRVICDEQLLNSDQLWAAVM